MLNAVVPSVPVVRQNNASGPVALRTTTIIVTIQRSFLIPTLVRQLIRHSVTAEPVQVCMAAVPLLPVGKPASTECRITFSNGIQPAWTETIPLGTSPIVLVTPVGPALVLLLLTDFIRKVVNKLITSILRLTTKLQEY